MSVPRPIRSPQHKALAWANVLDPENRGALGVDGVYLDFVLPIGGPPSGSAGACCGIPYRRLKSTAIHGSPLRGNFNRDNPFRGLMSHARGTKRRLLRRFTPRNDTAPYLSLRPR